MAFGGFNRPAFGQPQASIAPTFGSFGTTTTSTASAPAFNFGSSIRTTTPSFTGFGSTPSFGAAPTTSAFSFSTGTLGATTTAPTFGALGSTSFANPAATTSAFSFNLGTTTTSAPSFGGLGATQPSFSFGGSTAPTFGTGGFGGSTMPGTSFSMFGAQPAAATQPTVASQTSPFTALVTALSLPVLYGDERDAIIARWNQLQAFWGVGKGYYLLNGPPMDFAVDNPFSKFKCIGYSKIPHYNPEDGLVGLDLNKTEAEVLNQKQQIIELLHRIFGSRPNLTVVIDGVRSVINNKVQVIIYLEEKLPTGMTHRISSNDVMNHLQQVTVKTQLAQLGVENLMPKTGLSKEHLQHYLDNAPAGIDGILWKQAKLDNPNPDKYMPVAILGFDGLLNRLKCQQQETQQHRVRLRLIGDDIAELKKRQATTMAKIAENKRKHLELGQKLLRVMVKQEIHRKTGYTLQPEDEQIQNKLEAVQSHLNSPTEYRGRLKELLSQIRLHNHRVALKGENERYKLSTTQHDDIKQHLKNQSEGINYLISILKEDLKDLSSIENHLKNGADKR